MGKHPPQVSGRLRAFEEQRHHYALVRRVDAIIRLETLDAEFNREHGQALAARQRRDDALDAYGRWLSKFLSVAAEACADDPELLKQLGLA